MQHEPPTTDRETQLLREQQRDQQTDQQRDQQSQGNTTTGQSPNQQDHSQQPALTTSEATSPAQPPYVPANLTSADNAPADLQQKQQFQVPEQPDLQSIPQTDPLNHPGESTEMPGQAYPPAGTLNLQGKSEGTLLDDTMQELQLRSQPFTGPSAEGELFADEVTFSQINEIKQAIIKGDTVLVLTGEEGAGKTTLLKQLTRNSGTRLQFFSVKGGEKYTTHNLFSGILNAWKLTPPADFEDSTNEMLRALQANQERHTTVVLLLDDADLLPPKELHLLLATVQYFNGDEQLLRVILSAQPQFEAQLPQMLPQGLKLPYSVMQVEPMLASRAAPYIQLRLNQAGHFDEFPLSDKQVSAIANDASGYPGRINFLAAEALNEIYCPFTDSQTQSSKSSGFFSKFSRAGAGSSSSSGGIGKIAKALAALFGFGLIVAGIYSTTLKDKSGAENSVANNDSGDSQTAGNNTVTSNTAATSNVAANNSDFKTVETRPVVPKPATATDENVAGATATGDASRLEQVSTAGANAAANDTNANQPGATANSAAGATDAGNASAAAKQGQSGTAETELQAAASELSAALGNPTNSGRATATAANSTASPDANATTSNSAESTSTARPAIESTATTVTESTSPAADSTSTEAQAETQAETQAQAPSAETASQTDTTDQEANSAAIGDSDTTDTVAELPAATPASPTGASSEQTAEAAATETSADEVAANRESSSGDNVNGLESPNWVLLQDADQFTIQMSASTDRSDITRFLQAANLQKPTSIYSFKRGETTWYALVQGLYPNLGEARAAIKDMNKAAVKNQPWIRKIGSIQNSVKN